jgi:hypothetical protein
VDCGGAGVAGEGGIAGTSGADRKKILSQRWKGCATQRRLCVQNDCPGRAEKQVPPLRLLSLRSGRDDRASWKAKHLELVVNLVLSRNLKIKSEIKIPTLSRDAREGWGTRFVFSPPAFYFFEFFCESASNPKTPTPVVVPT